MGFQIICVVASVFIAMILEVQSQKTTVEETCSLLSPTETDITYCDDKNQCLSRRVINCVRKDIGFFTNCPTDKPYCEFLSDASGGAAGSVRKGKCSDKFPANDGLLANAVCTKQPNFICLQNGHHPSPVNCSISFWCNNGIANENRCPDFKMYNPLSTICDLTLDAAKCSTVNCTSIGLNGMAYFGSTKHIFVICAQGPNKDVVPLMNYCPVGTVANLNTNYPVTCDYACTKAGSFPNSSIPDKYFVCALINNVWKSTLSTCPQGTIFYENKAYPTLAKCA